MRSVWPVPRPSPARSSTTLLIRLQRELFVAGAELATAPDRRHLLEPAVSRVSPEMVAALEPIIDDVTARFEAPREFVLPGENRIAAALDVARTVVRRAGARSGCRDRGRVARGRAAPSCPT